MRNTFTFIFLIFLTVTMYSQAKKIIYVDEGYKKINFIDFSKKLESRLFSIARIETDTALFKKLRFKEFYGELELHKKTQLNKLFTKRFNIDSAKTWLIHYVDSLPDVKAMPKKSGYIIIDSLGNAISKVLSREEFHNAMVEQNINSFKVRSLKHRHVTTYEDYKKIIPSELREINEFLKNKNVSFIHFYGYNKGYPMEKVKHKWFRDYNMILKKTFTDGTRMYKTILVYPDGSFYLGLNSKSIRILSKKKYVRSQKRWQKQYDKHN